MKVLLAVFIVVQVWAAEEPSAKQEPVANQEATTNQEATINQEATTNQEATINQEATKKQESATDEGPTETNDECVSLVDRASFETTKDNDFVCDKEYILGRHGIHFKDGYANSEFALYSYLCVTDETKADSYEDWVSFDFRLYRQGFPLITFRKHHKNLVKNVHLEDEIKEALKNFKTFNETNGEKIIRSILVDDTQHHTDFFVYFPKDLYEPRYIDGDAASCFKISFYSEQKETKSGYREVNTAGLPEPAEERICEEMEKKEESSESGIHHDDVEHPSV